MTSVKDGVKGIIDRVVSLYNKDQSGFAQKVIGGVVEKMKSTVDKTSDENLLALLIVIKDDIDSVLNCD